MANQADPTPRSRRWWASVPTLLLLGAFLATSADSGTDPSTAAAPGEGRQPSRRARSVRVSDAALARDIEALGGRLAGDYGGYRVLEVDPSLARQISGRPGVDVRADDSLIFLNAGTIDTDSNDAEARRTALPQTDGRQLHLVQLKGPVRPEWHAAIEDSGVEIVTYVPNNAYLVYGDSLGMGRLRDLARAAGFIRWNGPLQDNDKIDPRISNQARASGADVPQTGLFAIQMVRDGVANAATMSVVDALRLGEVRSRFSLLNYENVIAELDGTRLEMLAARPDVVSIQPYVMPRRNGERQGQIVAGSLSGGAPTGPGYLDFLSAKGFTQSQFTTSGFAVDVTDSGIDDGTTTPNHFGLFVNGTRPGTSRVVYNRLEGTPHAGSTIQGCDGHGTINAHIVGGFSDRSGFPFQDASGYRYGLGIAPFVKVGSSVIFDPSTYTFPNLPNLQSRAYRDAARVSSNSWGAPVNGAYTVDSQTFDALVRDAQPSSSAVPVAGNQQMVVVFAAGNDGPGPGTLGAPGTAKNVITVGASENVHLFGTDGCGAADLDANSANDLAYFSSLGPTTDQRHKPDLVAPGTHVSGGVFQVESPGPNGTAGSCFDGTGVCGGVGSIFLPSGQQFYTASSGTSHSTPAVAGGAALVRQYFLNQGSPAPSPAMTKAFLMNSTRYLAGSGTNDTLWSNAQGMGLMDLGRAFDGIDRVLRDQEPADTFTASGQTRSVTGTITDASRPFRVTLAWTDAPGSTVGNAFRNDLDLVVTVGGATYRGNLFSGALSVTGGVANTRDNVESVFLPAGVTGNFVVTVTAANINSDGVPNSGGALDQDFALVVYNGVEALVPVIATAGATLQAEGCGVGNGAVDPGETVTVLLSLANTGNGDASSVAGTLLATGGVTSPSGPQDYGTLLAGGPATARPFTFTAAGTCGGTLAATLELTDGGAALGTVRFDFGLGTLIPGATTNFGPSGAISIPSSGKATPYPSTINVSGLSGKVTKVTATLNTLSHQYADDVDVLLVGPGGQNVLLMADAGGGANLSNVTLTFDDDAALALPDGSPLPSGTYRPGNYTGADSFPSPAPGPPYGTTLSVFNGTSPNGAWKLYVVDDFSVSSGNISGGWRLTIQTATPSCCTGPSAGITVTPTSGLTTTEAGGSATFTVALASPPSANVTIGLGSSDTTEGTVSPPSLTFTPADALTPKTVTVTGVNDTIVDGNVAYNIVTAAAVSADPAYSGREAADVSATNQDDDIIGITVTPTSGLVTTESGGTASFTIVLSSTPSADVTIGVTSSDTTEGTTSPTSLTFTPANALVPQTVTVTGVDDGVVDGNITSTVLTAAAVSADGDYGGLNPADILFTNADDDTAPPSGTEPVVWTSVVGATASGNSLTKTAPWSWSNAGAVSTQSIASGDGHLEFTAQGPSYELMAGLGNGDTSQSYVDIEYAIYARYGGLQSTSQGPAAAPLAPTSAGDRLRVGVENGVVTYRKNDVVFYQSTAPTYPLLVDTSLASPGATVINALITWTPPPSGTELVVWTSAVGAVANGNSLTKTAPWSWSNAGAVSTQSIVSGDGYLEFTAQGPSYELMAGLGNGDTSQSYVDIEYAIYARYGELQVYESGTSRGSFGTYSAGDRLRVGVENGVVKYRKNDVVFYQSTAPTYPLLVDTSLGSTGATVINALITRTPPPSGTELVVWTSAVGAVANGNSLTKTAPWSWSNAGAVSTQSIVSGDGYLEFTAQGLSYELMAGLGNGDTSQSYVDIEYAIYASYGRLQSLRVRDQPRLLWHLPGRGSLAGRGGERRGDLPQERRGLLPEHGADLSAPRGYVARLDRRHRHQRPGRRSPSVA